MSLGWLGRALTGVAVALAAVSTGGAAAALPAAGAGWHIATVLRHCGNDSMESVTAVAPADAWAVGAPNWAGPGCHIDLEHWNGVRWERVRTPRRASFGLIPSFSLPFAASSARDVWLFPGLLMHIANSYFSYNYALRWDGRHWHRSVLPGHPTVEYAAAFGPGSAWAFGFRYPRENVTAGYAARYTGHAWREITMPGTALGFAAVSPDDMWAIGPTSETAGRSLARQAFVAMHWNGRRWKTVPVPRPRLAGAGSYVNEAYVAAVSPRDVWWSYLVETPGGRSRTAGLLHWNGARWTGIAVPGAIGDIDGMSQDGAGGVWLIADADVSYDLGQYWYHYSGGRWSRQLVLTPRKYNDTMFGIAWIPRTTSLWSVGEADLNSGTPATGATVAVIARYQK